MQTPTRSFSTCLLCGRETVEDLGHEVARGFVALCFGEQRSLCGEPDLRHTAQLKTTEGKVSYIPPNHNT